MNKTKMRRKIMFSLIFMYFIAPQIWGGWMVLKLKIITFTEYLHMSTSPVTIALLILFFLINKRYYMRAAEKWIVNLPDESFAKVPRFHLISITLFGTVATFLAMLTLYFPQLGFILKEPVRQFETVITGMLAGASLTFIFFFLFTSIIIRSFDAIGSQYTEVERVPVLFKKYLPWNLVIIIAGMFLMTYSTVESVEVNYASADHGTFLRVLNINLLTLLLPFAMGTFLLIKQVISADKSRIVEIVDGNDENVNREEVTVTPQLEEIQA